MIRFSQLRSARLRHRHVRERKSTSWVGVGFFQEWPRLFRILYIELRSCYISYMITNLTNVDLWLSPVLVWWGLYINLAWPAQTIIPVRRLSRWRLLVSFCCWPLPLSPGWYTLTTTVAPTPDATLPSMNKPRILGWSTPTATLERLVILKLLTTSLLNSQAKIIIMIMILVSFLENKNSKQRCLRWQKTLKL